MSKVKIQGNASGTGTLTISAPNTNTDRTITLPDGAGEILTNASTLSSSNLSGALPAIDGSALTGIDVSGPSFGAYMSANQTGISSNTWTKMTFNTELFDTDSCYDTSSYRFTPTKAGIYQVNLSGASTGGSGTHFFIAVFKNGSRYGGASGTWITGNNSDDPYESISHLISMNGTTDYIEAYGDTDISNLEFNGGLAATNFSAVWIRSN